MARPPSAVSHPIISDTPIRYQTLWYLLAASVLLVMAAGCPRNVPQHGHSGKDYRYKGAKPVPLEDGEARVRDIVTYPGGDRVDWKVVALPEGQQGTLRVKLRWQPPRPGLDLAFDVYDEWFDRVAQVKPSRRGDSRSKSVKINNASGKYYIHIYAPRRMDAGRYTLSLRFKERKQAAVPTADELAGMIDPPPTLPAVPQPKSADEVAAEEAERVRLEEEQRKADEERRLDQDRLAELNKPISARITRTQRSSSGVIITISAGKNREVDKGWVGTLLSGDTSKPLPGGEFKVIRVTRNESIAKVALSMDQVTANPRVELRRSAGGE